MNLRWKYRKLEKTTYNILPKRMIQTYLGELIRKEWEIDHKEFPDQPWTVEWLHLLGELDFSLEKISLEQIILRPDLMNYQTSADNFAESLAQRVIEREESYKRGISFEPLLVNGRNNELMDGYTRYMVLRRNSHSYVYAYVGR